MLCCRPAGSPTYVAYPPWSDTTVTITSLMPETRDMSAETTPDRRNNVEITEVVAGLLRGFCTFDHDSMPGRDWRKGTTMTIAQLVRGACPLVKE